MSSPYRLFVCRDKRSACTGNVFSRKISSLLTSDDYRLTPRPVTLRMKDAKLPVLPTIFRPLLSPIIAQQVAPSRASDVSQRFRRWLAGLLAGELASWLANWLIGWLASSLTGWLIKIPQIQSRMGPIAIIRILTINYIYNWTDFRYPITIAFDSRSGHI